MLNQKCIRNHTIDYELARRHDTSAKKVKHERLIRKGDVLINSTGHGTLGRVAQVRDEPNEPTTVDSHITIVRPKNELFFLDYFGYAAIFIEDKIKEAGQGTSGQTELSRTKLKEEFFISFPSDFKEQKLIVSKLDAIFFEINEAINNNSCTISSTDLIFSKKLSQLFDKLIKDYQLQKMGEYYDVRDGTHDSPKYVTNGYPLVTSKNLKNGRLDLTNVKYIREYDYKNICKRSVVNVGDVLMAMIGTIGNPVVIYEQPRYAIKNVALFKLNHDHHSSEFLKFYLYYLSNKMLDESKGSTQKFVSLGYLRNLQIPTLTLSKQKEYANKLLEIEKNINHIKQNILKKKLEFQNLKTAILTKKLQSEAA